VNVMKILRRRKGNVTLNMTAERIGRTLGRVASKLDRWKRQRSRIAAELDHIVKVARGLRADLAPARRPANKIGRIAARAVRRARRRL
jgi:hypothetical protein